MEVEQLKVKNTKTRIKLGYIAAILCAIVWGIWYIPGNLIYFLEPFESLYNEVFLSSGDNTALLVTAILVTGLNATFVVIALTIWNMGVGKFRELARSIRQTKLCTRYFLWGAICGGPIAILGTFIASGFIGASFAACAALAYPIVGSVVSASWLGQKLSRRAIAGILVVLLGGLSIYAGGLITDLTSGNVQWLGYVGGLMAVFGWGIEGAVAAKGLDVSESDVGLTIRFIMETIIWWILIIPIVALMGFPIFQYAALIFEPVVLFVLIMLGVTFGFCYVVWYRAFPLVGVGRGQSIASLYGLFAVIFVFLFVGGEQSWTTIIGAVICIAGTFLMYTEPASQMESLREISDKGESG
ncbi:MAG: DMT family transporter [Methanomassiliicoccaceae archaeon]|nr:DMT family transporter [Methanomassiliicoccaceae archaeon]